jgi:mevalonate kinase
MPRTVIVSSPGKLILGGEHAVVYGRRALVTSIDMRLYMQLTETESTTKLLTTTFHDTSINHRIDLFDVHQSYPLEIQAILMIYEHFRSLLPSDVQYDLQVRSEIPIGAGLGSSAAFSVCLVGCFSRLCHAEFDRDEINRLAYRIECLFHGTPSGIDNTISTYGQSLVYSRTSKQHINFQLSNLAIIDTGIPKSTKRMVDIVRQLTSNEPSKAEQIFESIESCVDKMIEQNEQMTTLVRRNQELLVELGVSIPAIDDIIRLLNTYDVPCKITGAGGGGCLIALILPSMNDKLAYWLKEKNIKSIHFIRCGVEGLREEQTLFSS